MKKIVALIVVLLGGVVICQLWISARLDDGVVAYKQSRYEESFEILYPLAVLGNDVAGVIVGLSFAYGQGVDMDREKAKNFILSSDKNPEVLFKEIHTSYEKGGAVEKNAALAEYWRQLAQPGRTDH